MVDNQMVDKFSFRDRVLQHLNKVGAITARAMFGGFGLYLDGLMFGLIADAVLYFKVDDENRQDYLDLGLKPFVYEGKHKPIAMSYWQIPENILEDIPTLVIWVEKAHAAAKAAKAKQKPKRKPNLPV